jgi:hypothetical protein
MTREKAIETLVADGFDRSFAEKATDWFAGHTAEFREQVKFVNYIRANEYLIRHCGPHARGI